MGERTDLRAWIGSASASSAGVAAALEAGLSAVGRAPRGGERWAVKLNLTYPRHIPGVVNSPVFIEGLCRWASDRDVRLTLVEGDGGNGAYSAADAFDGNGVTELARRHGASCLSLSDYPRESWQWRTTLVEGKPVRLPYSPFFLRREYDRFVTAPVFKNHVFTYVSLGMKNLWGCIPDAYRMYFHHVLDAGIVALAKELRPDFSIFDGLVGLRGRGPMDGRPVEMNAVMVAACVGAGESAALEVMGVPMERVRHLQIARAEGIVPDVSQVRWLEDPAPFRRTDFTIERTWLHRVSIALAKSPRLQRLVYHSPLSRAAYAVAHLVRGRSPQDELVRAKHAGHYTTIPREDR